MTATLHCKAELPPQYGEWMTDPLTGIKIPKTMQGNVEWRQKLLAQAKESASWRARLKAASSKSPIFWLNAFGWTFLQKKVDQTGVEKSVVEGATIDGRRATPHVPFITWAVQDDAILKLTDAIENGHDALISKARDMGASWLCLAVFQWYWQFRPQTTFLELSRKETLVDRPGDMDSLFEKHRYLLRRQPQWLVPQRIKDNRLHLENTDTGSVLIGESTNKDAGQASRKTAILLDEFARVAEGDEIDLSTADTTACRIFNSTPGGPNTHFTRVWRTMRAGTRSGQIIELPWWRHPDKGRDAVYALDPERGECRWTSPWYELQRGRRTKRNLAQNVDMEHGKVGDSIFDADDIEAHRKKFEAEPNAIGAVAFDEEMTEERKLATVRKMNPFAMRWVQGAARSGWRLWVELLEWADDKGRKLLRPFQQTRYIFGVDISNGSGASNSVITVMDARTNRIVAKFWDAYTSPEELAEVAVFGAIWFGGIKPPLMVFEKNGPGSIFGRKLIKLGYPAVYYQKNESIKQDPKTPRWGWHSSPARKEMLLGAYREALKTEQVINPCAEALDEALDYQYDDKGRIEAGMRKDDDEGGGSALHGDHVIADALVWLGRQDLPDLIQVAPDRIPHGSFAARREAFKRSRRDREAWRK
jgi:hypothetical protein